jgi:hypothetical protein
MKGLDFNYQTSELAEINIPVPSDFSMNFDLNIMGYRMCQRQRSTMADYERASSSAPAAASPTTSTPPSN